MRLMPHSSSFCLTSLSSGGVEVDINKRRKVDRVNSPVREKQLMRQSLILHFFYISGDSTSATSTINQPASYHFSMIDPSIATRLMTTVQLQNECHVSVVFGNKRPLFLPETKHVCQRFTQPLYKKKSHNISIRNSSSVK